VTAPAQANVDKYPMSYMIRPMSTQPVSATLSQERVAEAKARVGERGFSRYLDEALARQLQFDRLADLEADLAREFGPIPQDALRQVAEMEWPR
jgi:hypothetical protein